jgi:glucose-6-phosphate isomerase
MIEIDYTFMLSDAVAGGVDRAAFTGTAQRFREVHAAVDARRRSGELGFFDLPTDAALLHQVEAFVGRVHGRFSDVVLMGIGGSSLGPIALRNALRPPLWNLRTEERREGWRRLHVLDNVDPHTVQATLDAVSLEHTLFLVISKSGGTAETMAQYLIVRERLVAAGLDVAAHLCLITDPAKGALRPIARADGIPAMEIPPNVGGRFSVLSPVGTLPAALIGIEIRSLLAGAQAMVTRCATDDLLRNPAGVYATLQWLADTQGARPVHVLMPYADALRDIGLWFVQLWAESLGKITPDGRHVGPTPVAAVGATDQHSQVQLFMEGPMDKTVTFLAVAQPDVDLVIPPLHAEVPDLAYLGGHTLWELLNIERRATAGALATRGRPSVTIELGRIDPWHLGGLLMFLEIATAYAGAFYGVNAFDQPGVEQGKLFTYGMMGRPGFDAERTEFLALPQPSPTDRV